MLHHNISLIPLFRLAKLLTCLKISALVVFGSISAKAAALLGDGNDCSVRADGVITDVGTPLYAGGVGSPVMDRAAVYVIQLPSLGVVANPFATATLRFYLAGKSGAPANMDLYGLGRRVSAAVVAGDYYGQSATVDTTDATLLQDNILLSTTANGVVSTSAAGTTALKNYLNAQYASGAGAGQYVFLRLSSDSVSTTVKNYTLTAAEGGTAGSPDTRPQISYTLAPIGYTRPFIWVRDSEKAGILAKIAGNAWATAVYDGTVARVAADVASHQANRDAFLRQLPVDWALATAKFKTIPAYTESSVRFPAEAKFNDALDCAVLYYLTGDAKYARCAADILHNAVKTLLPVAVSTSTGNGGWIFQDDYLKEARVTATQLPIIYDFLYPWLQTNQVYDVKTAAMVNFNFTSGQSVFRTLYQLARDHGQKDSNWSALMATAMLNNLLALDSSTERATALQVYLVTGTSRQASLSYDYRNYTQAGGTWPESLQYAGEVGNVRSTHLVMLERIDPSLQLFDTYPNFPLSLPRISYLRYPNGEQVSFGDGHRAAGGQPFSSYELVYQHTKARGRRDLTTFFGSLINGGIATNQYNRSTLSSYGALSMHDDPLQLLWQAASIEEPSVTPELPRTDTLPHAGMALQRNPAPSNNATYGLMGFVGGAGHVHSHASGMSMELFGMGQVMGAKSGPSDYGSPIHEKYYRLFASNNTVIVNGASRGEGGWEGVGINTVGIVAMEPQPFATAVSPNISFTCSSFADNMGTLAEGTQQRTLAIIRTSPTTGYYVDVFRSKSTVTNRVATTLNGNVTNQYHDYIYRNIGETNVDLRADGVTLPLVSQPTRFQNDIGDTYDQPGWRYFTNTAVSYPNSQSMRAQFVANVGGMARYMDMHMPAVASREYAKVDSPPIVDAPSPYSTRVAPTLVIRQIGEAWNKAFATVYEPHFGSTGGSVQNVTPLLRSGIVVGVKVESATLGKNLVQYVISNPGAAETFTDPAIGLSFTGRFGVASDHGDGTTTLYLGQGSAMSYRGNTVATVSGASSQAEARFVPGQAAVVTSNAAVNLVSAPPPPGGTWVPAIGGSFDWTNTANWNPATVPNNVGGIARQNIDLAGDQTVNVNTPIALGELVVGDTSGSQTTVLQKNTNGSLVFDQTDNGMAFLTRSADGTGNVTFSSDLSISLNDNLTVRLGGGSASSTLLIAGTLAGSGKSLHKESSGLTLVIAGANTYSGQTRILGGILSLNHALALQNSALDTFNSVAGDTMNGLRTTVTALTLGGLTGSTNLASVFTSTSGGYAGVTALTLNPPTSASHNFSGIIANGAAGMTVSKIGLGTQILSGINTYTGSTTLAASSGTLEIGGTGQLGNGVYAGAIAIGTGSSFRYSSSADQTLSGSISGAGSLIKNSGSSALSLTAANTAYTGPVTVSAGTLVLGHASALGSANALTLSGSSTLTPVIQNATINAPISISGSPTIHAPDFGSGSTVSTLTLASAMTGTGNVILGSTSTVASNSQQTIRLNAQSSYTGTTTLYPADNDANLIVKLGITNALPTTTVLSINGVAGGGSGRSARLDLNGFSQTIAGLQNIEVSLRSQQIVNSSATAATLTINGAADYTFSGNINGAGVSLSKSGVGTQTLADTNSYTGTTTINGGTLQGVVGGNCASSTVIINNTQATYGVAITDNTKTWTCAALTANAAGKLEFDFGSVQPAAIKPLAVTGLANFTAATPTVTVIANAGLAPGTYPLMTWGSLSGTAPTSVTISPPGPAASLSVVGNTLNLVIRGPLTYYWDNNGATAGFGTAAGIWAAPATGNATQGWSTDAAGATLPGTVTPATSDDLNFGIAATGLATGTITVSGTVHANSLTFASGSGDLILSGGTITLGGANAFIQANNAGQVINSALTLNANVSVIAGTNGNPVLNVNGPIGGTGNVTFTTQTGVNGTSGTTTVMNLGASSSYAGNTLITTANTGNALTIKAAVANALPTTTVLTLDGGNGAGSGRNVAYDLNGRNQTLAGLTNVIGRTLRGQRIENSSGTAATLTINDNTNRTFSGTLTGTNLSLTKSGTGTFSITGTTSYTGQTTVTAGTLSLGSANTNNDLSTVTIAATGALLQLNFVTTDTVSKLYIGTTQQPAGLYGHTSTGANNGGLGIGAMDAYFADDTGTLTVTTGPFLFSTWITGTFSGGATVPADQQDPNDDPDNDGIPNLLEYALAGLDPTQPNTLANALVGTTLTYTKRPGTMGLTYAIQESADLGQTDPWGEVAGPGYVNNATSISFTFTPSTMANNFLRLRVPIK